MVRYYTGVGSRDLPPEVFALIKNIAAKLAKLGYTLRSGSADGADLAFEQGAASVDPSMTEIYLPKWNFKSFRRIDGVNYITVQPNQLISAKDFYLKPTDDFPDGIMHWYGKMSGYNQAFHARNILQVTGNDGVISDFCIYYAPEDEEGVKGGTRSAVEISRSMYGISAQNLYFDDVFSKWSKWLR